ncbi:MAG: hypothetical protein KJ984_01795 [Nanoarchaeota archaeon]|nr:hypothetical protein [Nanoarchaeota archaeon]
MTNEDYSNDTSSEVSEVSKLKKSNRNKNLVIGLLGIGIAALLYHDCSGYGNGKDDAADKANTTRSELERCLEENKTLTEKLNICSQYKVPNCPGSVISPEPKDCPEQLPCPKPTVIYVQKECPSYKTRECPQVHHRIE